MSADWPSGNIYSVHPSNNKTVKMFKLISSNYRDNIYNCYKKIWEDNNNENRNRKWIKRNWNNCGTETKTGHKSTDR